MIFILSLIIAVGIYMYFYNTTRDSLNPFGVSISLYLIMYGLSTLNLSFYQEPMLFRTHIMSWIPVLSITLIGIHYCEKHRFVFLEERMPVVTVNYRLIMKAICGLCLLSAAYLIITREVSLSFDFSQSQILNIRKGEVAEQIYAGSGIIGKLTQLFPYTMVFVFYDLLYKDDQLFIDRIAGVIYCVLCTLYALFVLASRGTFLLSVLGILILLNKKYHFRAKNVGILLFGIMMAFTFYMGLRVISESAVFSGTTVSNKTFNSIYNYFALSFNNFDKLVRLGSPYTIIEYSFISLSRILGVYSESDIIRTQTHIFNSASFLYGFYHDLGWFGVIIWPTIIYLIIGKIYILSKYKKPELTLLLAMFGKAIFVLSFGNYFFGSISQELPYYAAIAILLFGYKVRQIFIIKWLEFKHIKIQIRRARR